MGQLFLVMSAEMYNTLTVVGDMGISKVSGTLWPCRFQVFPCRKSRPGFPGRTTPALFLSP
ncbi:hypothetical protein PSN_1180 [Pseudomonas sp. NGC7]